MKVRGKDVNFMRTVLATCEIADLCENGELENFQKLFTGSQHEVVLNKAKIMHYLAKGYEENKVYEDTTYEPNTISVEEIMSLSEDDYIALYDEAIKVFIGDASVSVETEEEKKRNEAT